LGVLNNDPTIHYIKGCRFYIKQFSVDSFLDWAGHHWVFATLQTPVTHSVSSDHSIRHTNNDNFSCWSDKEIDIFSKPFMSFRENSLCVTCYPQYNYILFLVVIFNYLSFHFLFEVRSPQKIANHSY